MKEVDGDCESESPRWKKKSKTPDIEDDSELAAAAIIFRNDIREYSSSNRQNISPFIPLNPVTSYDDYLYSLDEKEGAYDLFISP